MDRFPKPLHLNLWDVAGVVQLTPPHFFPFSILSALLLVHLTRAHSADSLLTYRILKGNLAPGGAVAKITGKEGLEFTGKARAFDTEDAFVEAVEKGEIKKGEKTVVVLRYLGPKGGPGESVSHDFSFSISLGSWIWKWGGSRECMAQTCFSVPCLFLNPPLATFCPVVFFPFLVWSHVRTSAESFFHLADRGWVRYNRHWQVVVLLESIVV